MMINRTAICNQIRKIHFEIKQRKSIFYYQMAHCNRKIILDLIFKNMKWNINIFFKPNSVKIRREQNSSLFISVYQPFPITLFSITQSFTKCSFKLSLIFSSDLRTIHPRRFKSPKSTSDYFRSLQLFKFLKLINGHLLATKPYLLFLQTGHFSNLQNWSEKCYLFFFHCQ